MAHKTTCDVCNKEIKYPNEVRLFSPAVKGDYCLDCWKDSKNWKQIHKVKE